MPQATRYDAIDVAKGIGIILVVYGHVIRGLELRGLAAGDWVRLHDTAIYAFHMPLFFFLSGMLVARGLDRSQTGFLSEKLTSIVYPYILWSVLQTGLAAFASPGSPSDVGLGALLLIWKQPISQFWFLYALFFCHVLLTLFWRWKPVLIALALFGLCDFGLRVPLPLHYALTYFPYVLAGWAVSRVVLSPGWPGNGWTLPAGLLAFCALFCGLYSVEQSGQFEALNLNGAPFVAFAGIAATLCLSWIIGARVPFLIHLGKASMAIYVVHTIVIGGVRLIEIKSGFTSPVFMVVSLTLVGLFVPLVAYAFSSRAQISRIIGFGRDDRQLASLLRR